MVLKDVIKIMTPFFKEHGYSKKGSMFYKIQNQIAYCISFEHPGGLYVISHIIPFYIPLEIPSIAYGGRLNQMKSWDVPVEFYLNDMTEDACIEWCNKVKKCCKKHIFPLYDEIGSLSDLINFLNKGEQYVKQKFVGFCGLPFYELRAYTNFMLSDYKQMVSDIQKANFKIDAWPVYPYIKEKKRDELNKLLVLANSKEDKQAYIQQSKTITCRTYLGKKFDVALIKD